MTPPRIEPVIVLALVLAWAVAVAGLLALYALQPKRPDLSGVFVALAGALTAAVPAIVAAVYARLSHRSAAAATGAIDAQAELTNQRVRQAAADAVRAALSGVVPDRRASDTATESQLAAAVRRGARA